MTELASYRARSGRFVPVWTLEIHTASSPLTMNGAEVG